MTVATALQQGNDKSIAAGLVGLSTAATRGYGLLKQPGDPNAAALPWRPGHYGPCRPCTLMMHRR